MRAGDGFAALAKITPRSTAQLESKCVSPNTEAGHKDILFLASKTTLSFSAVSGRRKGEWHSVLQTTPLSTHTLSPFSSLFLFPTGNIPLTAILVLGTTKTVALEKRSFLLPLLYHSSLSASSLAGTSLLYAYIISLQPEPPALLSPHSHAELKWNHPYYYTGLYFFWGPRWKPAAISLRLMAKTPFLWYTL